MDVQVFNARFHVSLFPIKVGPRIQHVEGGVGGTWFASARAFARLSPGYARDPERKMPNQIHAALAYSKLARRNLKD